MAGVVAIRDALKTALETIDGLRAHDTMPSTVSPPVAVVAPAPGQFIVFDSSAGSDDYQFIVYLVVSLASDRAAQDTLDGYLAGSGALSVRAAVNLTSGVDYVAVTGASDYGLITVGGIDYLGCTLAVTIGTIP